MGEQTAIEWVRNTDGSKGHTFNPWVGCARVSPGCSFCYAATQDERWSGGIHWGKSAPRRITSDANWRKPLKWNRDAEAAGRRDRVFCASLADVFEDRDDLIEPRTRLFRLIQQTPHLDWLLLTKRTENMARMLPWTLGEGLGGEINNVGGDDRPWPNIWLGTTVEDQQRADERIPALVGIPAAIRFLSCEPLVGPVDIHGALPYMSALPDWVICGGESGGRKARPMHPDWAREIRDQCAQAGIQFHFKQWGSWAPDHEAPELTMTPDGTLREVDELVYTPAGDCWDLSTGGVAISYKGQSGKSGGRLLDYRQHDDVPGVPVG